MSVEELLAEVEARGAMVLLDREGLLVRPRSRLTPELIDALRCHKDELRGLVELRGWPETSRKAVERFGSAHARLYPFLGRAIATPEGTGQLVQVFSERASVLFEDAAGRRLGCFLPSELTPPDTGLSSLIESQEH